MLQTCFRIDYYPDILRQLSKTPLSLNNETHEKQSSFFSSCNNDKLQERKWGVQDTQLPVISITSPTNNQVFSAGQTVNINATITDNEKLEEVHLEITNTTTGTFLTHEHYAPDAASYTLSRILTTQAATTYKIKVEAHDANENIAKTEVMIMVN